MSISLGRLLASASIVFTLFALLDAWTAYTAIQHADVYALNPLATPHDHLLTLWRNLLALVLLIGLMTAGFSMGKDHINALGVLPFREYYSRVKRWEKGWIQAIFFIPLCIVWYRPVSILNNTMLTLFNWSPLDPARQLITLVPGVTDSGAQALLNAVIFVLCMKWLLMGCWWLLQISLFTSEDLLTGDANK